MSTKSKARGTETERMVVRYLNENGFPTAERRALAGANDKGDVTGIDDVVIEIKGDRSNKVSAWRKEAVKEARNAKARFYFLVVRIDHKSVERWEAHVPAFLLRFGPDYPYGPVVIEACDDCGASPEKGHVCFCGRELWELGCAEDWTWVRMDLRLAVSLLWAQAGFWPQSSPTTA